MKNTLAFLAVILFSLVLTSTTFGQTRYGIVGKNVAIKSQPERKAAVIGHLEKNDRVVILDEVEGHFKIEDNKGIGFIKYKHIKRIETDKAVKINENYSSYTGMLLEPLDIRYQEYDVMITKHIDDTRLKLISPAEYNALGADEKCTILVATPFVYFPEAWDENHRPKFSIALRDCNQKAIGAYKNVNKLSLFSLDESMAESVDKAMNRFKEDL